jgi:hypothetical protein
MDEYLKKLVFRMMMTMMIVKLNVHLFDDNLLHNVYLNVHNDYDYLLNLHLNMNNDSMIKNLLKL